jgi:hypothetical protein
MPSPAQELVQVACDNGYKDVTTRRIHRFRHAGAIPKVIHSSDGRGGIKSENQLGTSVQVLRLLEMLEEDRNLAEATFSLWIEGHNVALDTIRKILGGAIAKIQGGVARLKDPVYRRDSALNLAETMARRKKSTESRARSATNEGDPLAIEMVLSGIDFDETRSFANALEAMLPGRRALANLGSILDEMSDAELLALRKWYADLQTVRRLLQSVTTVAESTPLRDFLDKMAFPVGSVEKMMHGVKGFVLVLLLTEIQPTGFSRGAPTFLPAS